MSVMKPIGANLSKGKSSIAENSFKAASIIDALTCRLIENHDSRV